MKNHENLTIISRIFKKKLTIFVINLFCLYCISAAISQISLRLLSAHHMSQGYVHKKFQGNWSSGLGCSEARKKNFTFPISQGGSKIF
jgi:hypothetical protein